MRNVGFNRVALIATRKLFLFRWAEGSNFLSRLFAITICSYILTVSYYEETLNLDC